MDKIDKIVHARDKSETSSRICRWKNQEVRNNETAVQASKVPS